MMTFQHDLQDELLDVRRMFEPAVARVAASRATDEDFADLQRILDAQQRKLKNGQSAIVEDTAFHAALARSTRNRVVVSLMATLNDLLVESRKLTLKQKGVPRNPSRDTKQLLRRCAADAEGAAQAMYSTSIRSPVCNCRLASSAETPASSGRRNPWMKACERRSKRTCPTLMPDPPRASASGHVGKRSFQQSAIAALASGRKTAA